MSILIDIKSIPVLCINVEEIETSPVRGLFFNVLTYFTNCDTSIWEKNIMISLKEGSGSKSVQSSPKGDYFNYRGNSKSVQPPEPKRFHDGGNSKSVQPPPPKK